MSANNYNEVDS